MCINHEFLLCGRFMLACDQCGNWLHGDCVGVTEEEGDLMDKQDTPYICPKCKEPGTVFVHYNAIYFFYLTLFL